ncbi:MAG: hypothetical protein PF447_04770 [Spirochaetaceae bacterium]|nr:hypothetical protein [Spirochaetaceae bacterium]
MDRRYTERLTMGCIIPLVQIKVLQQPFFGLPISPIKIAIPW